MTSFVRRFTSTSSFWVVTALWLGLLAQACSAPPGPASPTGTKVVFGSQLQISANQFVYAHVQVDDGPGTTVVVDKRYPNASTFARNCTAADVADGLACSPVVPIDTILEIPPFDVPTGLGRRFVVEIFVNQAPGTTNQIDLYAGSVTADIVDAATTLPLNVALQPRFEVSGTISCTNTAACPAPQVRDFAAVRVLDVVSGYALPLFNAYCTSPGVKTDQTCTGVAGEGPDSGQYAVMLTAGRTYEITTTLNGLDNTYDAVMNPAATILAEAGLTSGTPRSVTVSAAMPGQDLSADVAPVRGTLSGVISHTNGSQTTGLQNVRLTLGHTTFNPQTDPPNRLVYGTAVAEVLTNTTGNYTINAAPGFPIGTFPLAITFLHPTVPNTQNLTVNLASGSNTLNGTFVNVAADSVVTFPTQLIAGDSLGSGGTHAVQVVDRDFAAGIMATITNPSNSDSETVALTETPPASGTWVMALLPTAPATMATPGDGTLQVRAGESVQFSVTDPVAFNGQLAVARTASASVPPPVRLAFGTAPLGTQGAGQVWPAFTVRIEDASGNLDAANTSNVTLSLASGTGVLSGTLTQAAVAGIATFNDISYATAEGITIDLTSPGLASTTTSNVAITVGPGTAAQLGFVTAPSASATAGSSWTPFSVEILDALGNRVVSDNSTVVAVSLATGSGTLSGTLMATASAGVATFNSVSYNLAQPITVDVTAPGLTGLLGNAVTVSAGAPAALQFGTPLPASAVVSSPWTSFSVQIVDAQGNFVPTATNTVTVALASGTGVLSGMTSVAAVAGVATFTGLSYDITESITVDITSTGLTPINGSAITIGAGTPAQISFGTAPVASVTAGAAWSPFTVRIEDSFGNLVPTATNTVTVSLNSGTGALGGTLSVAAVAGIATFSTITYPVSEAILIDVTSAGLTPVGTTGMGVTVTPGAPTQLAFGVAPTGTGTAGTAWAGFTVRVEDSLGNLVTSATDTVTVALATGTGALSGTLSVAAVSGIASFGTVSYDVAEGITVNVTAPGLTGILGTAVTIGPGAAAQLVFGTAPTGSETAGAAWTAFTVRVEDALGNLVTGATDTVTVSLASGTGALSGTLSVGAVGGIAAFSTVSYNTAEAITVDVTAPGLTGILGTPVTVSPGTASQLVFGTAPTGSEVAGSAWTAFTVRIEDALGNLVTGATDTVDVSLASGAGTLSGTTSVAAVGGIASFSTVSYDVAEAITVDVTSGVLTGILGTAVTVTPGTAAQLAFGTAPSGLESAGITWTTFDVRIEDALGNLVTSATDTVTVALATGTGALSGTLSVAAVSGIATFSTVSYDVAEGITVDVTAPGLTGILGTAVTVSPDTAAQLVFGTAPIGSEIAGTPWTTFTVRIEDALGNLVTSAVDTVDVTLASGTGTLSGTVSVPAVAGIAAFSTISYDVAEAINIDVTSGVLTGILSTPVTVAPGAATQLAFGTAPTGSETAGQAWTAFDVRIEDALGNLVTGATDTVDVTLASGTGILYGTVSVAAAGGIATFNTVTYDVAEGIAVDVTSGVLTGILGTAVTVSPAAPFLLALPTPPQPVETAGGIWTPFVVQVLDSFGNLVTTDNSTVVSIINITGSVSGATTLSGTLSQLVSGGVATFSDISYSVAENISFLVDDGGALVDVGAGPVIVSPGTPAQLAFGTAPTGSESAGVAWTTFDVRIEDSFGNLVTSATDTVTVSLASGTGALSGTLSTAAVGGIATFGTVSYDVAEAITIDVTSGVLTGILGTAVTVSSAGATQLAFGTAPTGSETAGAPWTTFDVRIEDGLGNLVTSATDTVTVALASGTGTLSGTLSVAAVGGIATFNTVSYDVAEAITVDVTSGVLTGILGTAVTVSPGAATQLAFGTAPTGSETAGAPWITFDVRIEDAFGNLVAGAADTVTVALGSGTGVLSGTLSLAAVGGIATFSTVSYDVAEAITIDVNSGVLTGILSTPVTVAPGAAAQLTFGTAPTGSETAGIAWTTFDVRIEDAFGNLVASAADTVTVALASGTGALSGTLSTAAVGGVATFSTVSYDKAEAITIDVTSGVLTGILGTPVTVSAGAAAQLAFGTAPSGGETAGIAWASFDVRIEDAFGNLVTSATDTVSVNLGTGTGTLSGTVSLPAVGGIATFSTVSYDVAEAITIDVMSGVLTGILGTAVTVAPGAATQLTFGTAPTGSEVAGVAWTTFDVRIEDTLGNLVTSATDTVTVSLASGAGTLSGTLSTAAVGGIATFSTVSYDVAEAITIDVTSGVLTGILGTPVTVSFAGAAQLAFGTAPTGSETAGTPWTTFDVRIEDGLGNLVTSATDTVTIALASGTGALSGTLSVAAVGGIATFSTVSYDVAEAIAVDVTSGVLTGISGTPVSVSPGAAAQLAFGTAPTGSETAGTPWTTFDVRIEDAFGNLITGAMDTVTVALGSGTGALSGTLSVAAVGGIATFNTVSYNVAEAITVDVTSGVLTGILGTAVTVAPGTATQLVFGTAPTGSETAGAPWTAFDVRIEDAFGNLVTGATDIVTVSLASGTGTLLGTLSVPAVSGVATFGTVSYNTAEAITMDVNSGVLTGILGTAVTVVPGAAAQLAFGTPPSGAETAGIAWMVFDVRIEDAFGNLVTSAADTVTVSLGSGTGTLSGTLSLAAAGGVATFSTVSYDVAEAITVDVTSGVLTGILGTPVTVSAGSPAQMAWGTTPSGTETAGSNWISYTIEIHDSYGNLVTGDSSTNVTVTGDGLATNGGFSGNSTTVSNGVAFFASTVYLTAESFNVTANATPPLTPPSNIPVTVSNGPGNTLVFSSGPVNSPADGRQAVSVSIYDAYGNLATSGPDATTAVTLSISFDPTGSASLLDSLTGPLANIVVGAVAGIATFNDLMTPDTSVQIDKAGIGFVLTADATLSGAGPVSQPSVSFDITSGASTQLAFGTAPSGSETAGIVWGTFTVEVLDAFGNLNTGATDLVTVTLASGTGPLMGTLSVNAVAGIASFSTLSSNTAESLTIDITAAGLASLLGTPVTVAPNSPSYIGISTAPAGTQTAGITWSTFDFTINDLYGNLVTTATDTVTLSLGTGTGPLLGTLSVAAVGGVATFSDISSNTAEAITIDATSGILTPVTGIAVTVNPDVPTQLVFGTPPVGPETAGMAWTTFTVEVQDTYGNIITSDNGTVITVAGDGTEANGGFTGNNVAVANGVATFSTLTYATAESINVGASSSPVYTSPATIPVTVNPGAIGQLAIIGPDPITTDDCAVYTIESRDSFGNVSNVGALTTVDVFSTGIATFYSDAACTPGNEITQTSISGGMSQATVYLHDSSAEAINLTASENPSQGWTAGNLPVTVNVGAPVQLAILTAPQNVPAGTCSSASVDVEARDSYNNPSPVPAPVALDLTSDSGTLTFYSDAACTPGNELSPGSVSIPMGVANVFTSIYYTDTVAGTPTIFVDDNAAILTGTSQIETIDPAASAQAVFTTAPQALLAGQCSGVVNLEIQDMFGNPTYMVVDTYLDLTSTSGTLVFYSDAACTPGNELTQATVIATVWYVPIYFRDTVAGIPTIQAMENPSQGWSPAGQSETINPAAPSDLFWTGPTTITAGQCGAYAVESRDLYGNLSAVTDGDHTFNLSTGTGTFYLDAACTPGNEITQSTIVDTTSSASFYYRSTSSGSPVLSATDTHGTPLNTGNLPVTIDPDVPSQLVISTAPQSALAGQCSSSSVYVETQDMYGNVSNATSLTFVDLSTDSGSLLFYSDMACSGGNEITQVAIAQGTSYALFNFSDTTAGNPTIYADDNGAVLTGDNQIETIDAGTALAVAFVAGAAPPTKTQRGVPMSFIAVQVEDAYGNRVVTDSVTGTGIAVVQGDPGQLAGDLAKTVEMGVASFGDVRYGLEQTIQLTTTNNGGLFDQSGPIMEIYPNPVIDDNGGLFRISGGPMGQANNLSGAPAISRDGRFVAYESAASNLVGGDSNGTVDIFVGDFLRQQTERVNVSSLGGEANGLSAAPSISADGRYVAFDSVATSLVTGDTNASFDIFVRDRLLSTTVRLSVASGGVESNSDSREPSISGDGRFVAFRSIASNLVAGDTNGLADIFVHDRLSGQMTRVSVDSVGTEAAGGDSFAPAISADGRFVAFSSDASNLVGSDTNGWEDIFVHDQTTGVTIRVNVDSLGAQSTGGDSLRPSISADGRFVAFESGANNLIAGDANGAYDVFVHDRATAVTRRVSVSSTGAEGNGASTQAFIDPDGAWVAFSTTSTNLNFVPDTNGWTDVYLRSLADSQTFRLSEGRDGMGGSIEGDSASVNAAFTTFEGNIFAVFESAATNLEQGDTNGVSDIFYIGGDPFDFGSGQPTERVSVDSAGTEASGGMSDSVALSGDGGIAAFASGATNLVAGDGNASFDVFVHDRNGGAVTRMSVATDGTEGNGGSAEPSISGDGRFVAFSSTATNLVPADTNGVQDIFVRDRAAGETRRVSVQTGGAQAGGASSEPAISLDGRYVAFTSAASDLVASDLNVAFDIFVHDLVTGDTVRVSVDSGGTEANGDSASPSVSANGRFVAFDSAATNLVAGDGNTSSDVFVHDRLTGQTSRVSVDSAGLEANGDSVRPSISADGRFVAFNSFASNLVTSDSNGTNDIFVRDRSAGRTIRVSVDSSGAEANGFSDFPSISVDGRFVAFESPASNLIAGDLNGIDDIFVHDLQTGQTLRASVGETGSEGNSSSLGAAMSANGSYVGFTSSASNLVGSDLNVVDDVFVAPNPAAGEFPTNQPVEAASSRTSLANSPSSTGASDNSAVSFDGRYVAFQSDATDLTSGSDTNGFVDVFVRDRVTLRTIRASVSTTGVEANGTSSNPDISADGRYVAFQSAADNLVSPDTGFFSDIFLHDVLTGETTMVSVDSAGNQGNGPSTAPAISPDGRYVVFMTLADNLDTAPDTNGYDDVYLRDVVAGTTRRVSLDSTGAVQGNAGCYYPDVSHGGRYIAFESTASNLVAGDSNSASDVFHKDMVTGALVRVSVDAAGVESVGASYRPSISWNGNQVAFESLAGTLTGVLDTNGVSDIYIKDVRNQQVYRMSNDTGLGEPNGGSYGPAITWDGKGVAFQSDASNLVLNDTNSLGDVFINVQGNTRRISVTSAGSQLTDWPGFSAAISANGAYVAFDTTSAQLNGSDVNGGGDVYITGNPFLQPQLVVTSSITSQTAGQIWSPVLTVEIHTDGMLDTGATDCITITLTGGSATLQGTLTQCAVAGMAAFPDLRYDKAEEISFDITAPGTQGSYGEMLMVQPGAATTVAFTPGFGPRTDEFQYQPWQAIQVEIRDAFGNRAYLQSDTIGISIVTGSGTLMGTGTQPTQNGVAVFNDISYDRAEFMQFRFDSITLGIGSLGPYSMNVQGCTPGLPAQLGWWGNSPWLEPVGRPWTQFQIGVLDCQRQLVSGATDFVTLSRGGTGTGNLGGTTGVNAVNGIATFNDISYDTVEFMTLTASAAGLLGISDWPVDIDICNVGAPWQLVWLTPPPSSVPVSTTWPSFSVEIRDCTGINVPTATDTIQIFQESGPGSFSGTLNQAASGGTVYFNDISYNVPGQVSFDVWSPSIAKGFYWIPVSIVGPPDHLAFGVTPNASQQAGNPWVGGGQPFTVRIEDAGNNLVTTDNSTQVQVSLASGTASLNGSLIQTVSGGIAAFANVSYNKAEAITVNINDLGFTLAGISGHSVFIQAAGLDHLAFGVPPPAKTQANVPMSFFTVEAQDMYGNAVGLLDGLDVEVALYSGGGTLSGSLQRQLQGGRAAFNDVRHDTDEVIELTALPVGFSTTNAPPIQVDVEANPEDALKTTRVSVSSTGAETNGPTDNVSVSGDGRFVAFGSSAGTLVTGDTNGLYDVFVHDRLTGKTDRVSVSTTAAQGDGHSFDPAISADGRYVAFESGSTTFLAGNFGTQDIWVHDRLFGTTNLVSVPTAGSQANGSSANPAISPDGRFIVFDSTASDLASTDANAASDVFIFDQLTKMLERASVGTGALEGNGASQDATVSADGRFVAFSSAATNFAVSDTNGNNDVFVRDRMMDTLALVSRIGGGSNPVAGASNFPSISADGRLVAFTSTASDVVSGDTNAQIDVFVRDMQKASTRRISVDSAGSEGLGASAIRPSISADGRYVAFESGMANLVPGDTNGWEDIFVHDLVTAETARANLDAMGAQATGGTSIRVSLSTDGRYLAFESAATNLVMGDGNTQTDAFLVANPLLKEIAGGQAFIRASVDSAGALAAGGASQNVAFSYDGRFIAFQSFATNLVANDTNGYGDVFIHDRVTQKTTVVSVASNGALGNNSSTNPSISSDGRYVAYASSATNLGADANTAQDVFVRDRLTGDTILASVDSVGTIANGQSFGARISGNGRFVAFQSAASNLVAGDGNAADDFFVRDLDKNTTERISLDTGGGELTSSMPGLGGISYNGRYVTWYSDAPYAGAADTNGAKDVYLRDRLMQTTELVSLGEGGVLGTIGADANDMSADGRFIVFVSGASNLVAGDANVQPDAFVRDRLLGTTRLVSRATDGTQNNGIVSLPSISADGRYVAFQTPGNTLVPGDTNAAPDVFVHDLLTGETRRVSTDAGDVQVSATSQNARISPNGEYIGWDSSGVFDGPDTNGQPDILVKPNPAAAKFLTAQPVALASANLGGTQGNNVTGGRTALTADGGRIFFDSSASNLAASDLNGSLQDIFAKSRTTMAVSLHSIATNGTQGDADSYNPAISPDGRYVAFASTSTNLVPGDTNGATDVFLRDTLIGETRRVSVDSMDVQGNAGSDVPAISSDGRYVAFNSDASNMVTGDTNATTDIFVRDTLTGITKRVSVDSVGAEADGQSFNPSISADGRRIAFQSIATNLVASDTNGTYDIFVHDTLTGETRRVSVDSSGLQANGSSTTAQISADGRYVAFASQAQNLVAGDTNGWTDIFVHALQTGATTRVSVDSGGAEGDGNSGVPAISEDNRFVVFYSDATNLAAGDTNGATDIFVRDRFGVGATAIVSVDGVGMQGNGASSTPSISANGAYIAFISNATNLVSPATSGTQAFVAPNPLSGMPGDVSIGDQTLIETGVTIVFTVMRSGDTSMFATVDYATADGTATAGSDYTAASGTVTFNPGETSKPINISLIDDATPESNETFTVILSNPVNMNLIDPLAVGTITSDE